MSRLERLDDYVTGHMTDDAAASFEEEMFAAAATGGADAGSLAGDVRFFDRARELLTLIARLPGYVRAATAADVDALRERVRLHVVDISSDGGPFEIWPEDVEVVVFRLHVDARGYEDIELAVHNADGTPIKTFRGIQCDPTDGNVYGICAAPLAKMAFGAKRRISRFTGVRGGRREEFAVLDTTPVTR